MRLLPDTHAYLWWRSDDPQLSDRARRYIADPESTVFVSAATIWEIAIKIALGRLELEDPEATYDFGAQGFLELAITSIHARAAGELPPHHDDPFDRMLVAQAQAEALTLLSADRTLAAYGIPIGW